MTPHFRIGLAAACLAVAMDVSGACQATHDDGVSVFTDAANSAAALQAAVDAASPGGTVKIAGTCAGTQIVAANTQTVHVSKALTLEGGYPTGGAGAATWTSLPDPVAHPTLLDAQSAGRVIYATAALAVRGLTVQNGHDGGGALGGGGIIATSSLTLDGVTVLRNVSTSNAGNGGGGVLAFTGLVIRASTFRENQAAAFGGGFFGNGAVAMEDSVFVDNTSGNSAGGGVGFGVMGVTRSEFRGNRAGGGSAGLYIANGGTISHARFIDNRATGGGGGGIYLQSGTLAVSDSLFSRNDANVQGTSLAINNGAFSMERTTIRDGVPGAAVPAIGLRGTATGSIRNSIIAGAEIGIGQSASAVVLQEFNLFHDNDADFSGTVGGGTGSLNADPLFADAASDDLRLRHGSPALDAGDPGFASGGTDLAGNPRVAHGRLDMGAYEMRWHTVTPTSGANGAIAPATAQDIVEGSPAVFTVTPDAGYAASMGGTCGGSLAGTTYTTNAITADCTVTANFTLLTYTVTPGAGANGAIAPATPQAVGHGGTAVFTVTPDPGYTATVGGTCGGNLVGDTYTTNPVIAACTVDAAFSLTTYTVTPTAGANGSIAPAAPQTIGHGATATFTVTPDVGYAASVGGSCGGSLVGNTFTTNPVTANCTVDAAFVVSAVKTFTGPSATGSGTITATFTGGGAACTYTHAQFIAVEGHGASPPAGTAPDGIDFPHGLFDFALGGCTPGSTISMSITYPGALPAGAAYWKYGPTASNPTPHWYVMPATLTGNTAVFAITDGGLGDDDLAANGTIVDQGGPGTGGAAIAVPTLSQWALLLLASLMLFAGMRRARGGAGR